ncbi:MAG: integrase core domain-containing protein [Candidatus Helarchaeota archaeon]|nr:integrase core domain-containing protein [Candidatus Helarchaeota archaeon]
MGINRSTYYRRVLRQRVKRKNNTDTVILNQTLRELAEANPALGYRRIWAEAKAVGYNKSISTAYRELKRGGFLLDRPSYAVLKEAYIARKEYLVKPTGPNQLFQSDFTSINIVGYPFQPLLLVMDYYSRYLLVLKLCLDMTADSFISGLEDTLEEAMKLTTLPSEQVITLVTDNGPAMTASQTTHYLEMSPYFHVRSRSHHPHTTGMVERLIRTIKVEEVYLHDYRDPADAQSHLDLFRQDYNRVRQHQALKYRVPYEVYTGKIRWPTAIPQKISH